MTFEYSNLLKKDSFLVLPFLSVEWGACFAVCIGWLWFGFIFEW